MDQLELHAAEGKNWNARRDLFDTVGIPVDGWVHPEEFEAKAKAMLHLVNLIVDAADDEDSVKRALQAWKLSRPISLSGSSG